jgi:hypothetical protein
MDENAQNSLDKYVLENNIADNTPLIQSNQYSKKVKSDLLTMKYIKNNYKSVEFINRCNKKCIFLKKHQPKLFDKLISDMSLETLKIVDNIINLLHKIEIGELNQHQGSYYFGELCKTIFIDPVINNDNDNDTEEITWSMWKDLYSIV